jgi:hypothetical protein
VVAAPLPGEAQIAMIVGLARPGDERISTMAPTTGRSIVMSPHAARSLTTALSLEGSS